MVEQFVAMYDGNVRNADRAFGEFVKLLDQSKKTLVVVAADHGESLGEHARVGHNTLYQEVLHTPILVRLPSRSHAVLEHPVSNLDLVPTVLDLVGVERPGSLRGSDLFLADRALEVRIAEMPNARAIRRGRYKLIERRRQGRQEIELFDLEADPAENRNLAASRPELLSELRKAGEASGQPRPLDEKDPTLEALRALGYIEE
jgi:iduronate 2-sulfatase